mmetsp:Transcript_5974/g.9974  ORF Transcript_5974/g.9974 Transcript_5974/m.9974 type:complete len:299 (-) Transcript_5974:802-1698(-)
MRVGPSQCLYIRSSCLLKIRCILLLLRLSGISIFRNSLRLLVVLWHLTAIGNDDIHLRFVTSSLLHHFHLTNDVHALHHVPKHYVLTVEMRRVLGSDEELASICTRSCVRHAQLTLSCVLKSKVLVGKLLSVDRFAACTISICKVTTLNHKVLDDTMESATLVMQGLAHGTLALLASTERSKVLCRFWNNIGIQSHDDTSHVLVALFDVKENMRIVFRWLRHSLLVLVQPTRLAEQTSKGSLLLLLGFLIFLFQCRNSLAYILVGVIQLVGSHKVRLGFLEQAHVHSSESSSVKTLDI